MDRPSDAEEQQPGGTQTATTETRPGARVTPRRARTRPGRGPIKWKPIAIAVVVVLAVAAGLAYWFLLRDSGEPRTVFVRGRSLELHVTEPQIVEKVAFMDGEGRHRVIRPRATNRQLAVVNVTVVNRTSVITPLLIDPDAARLGSRRGERITALDPFAAAQVVEAADPEEGRFVPLLWGDVQLDRNYQVQGWMVFDVPKGLLLGTFWWEEVDSMSGDFVDYTRTR